MPYTRFVKKGNTVDVYKREGGREKKAFTSNNPSMAEAHKTAAMREAHSLMEKGAKKKRGKS